MAIYLPQDVRVDWVVEMDSWIIGVNSNAGNTGVGEIDFQFVREMRRISIGMDGLALVSDVFRIIIFFISERRG